MFVASADFPIAGLEASTIRLPGWKPPVMSSMSLNPEGVPVIEIPSRETRSSFANSSWRTDPIDLSSPVWSSCAMR